MRLIDSNVVEDAFTKWLTSTYDGRMPVDIVAEIPTVDAVEVKHGRWESHPNANGFERCSVCHDCIIYDDWADEKKWYYCPNCGADMRERKNND